MAERTNDGVLSGTERTSRNGAAMTGLEADVREAYTRFGEREARGNSPFYEDVCALIAADDALLERISTLPPAKRQPNLVLGAARFLGAPDDDAEAFVTWLTQHWGEVEAVARERATQTNEAGRCATLLPFVAEAARGRPVALVEVGCSAGLALFPDLYSYRFRNSGGEIVVGDGSPGLVTTVTGEGVESRALPADVPQVAWRGGLDLNPLDVLTDSDVARDNARWLEALVWPGQRERAERLRGCIATVRGHLATHPDDRPHVIRGDVVADLDALLADVLSDLHLVLFHSAVLAYTDETTRAEFTRRMGALGSRAGGFTWISNEGPGVMPGVAATVSQGVEVPAGRFVLAVDGVARALVGPHGQAIEFLAG